MTGPVGTRIREIRTWRGVSLRTAAELAGISPGYLSMIETGERPLQKRSVLESIAAALRVSPADLGAVPVAGVLDTDVSRARGALPAVEAALTEVFLGESTVRPRPLPDVLADLDHLRRVLKPRADVAGQMEAYPGLLRELHALWSQDHSDALLGHMAWLYLDVSNSAGSLGANSTAGLAVAHMREVTARLDDPLWAGLSAYGRALGLGAAGLRERAREVSLVALDGLDPSAGDPHRQIAGSLHLTAALSSAATGDGDQVTTHVAEARTLAESGDDPDGTGWAGLCFSRTNVGIWETSLALELGDPGRTLDVARRTRPEDHPSWSRQGAFHGDVARALATDRKSRGRAVQALVRAEALAPVRTRSNVWLRETARDLLRQVKRDSSEGRELRSVAHRMGLAA